MNPNCPCRLWQVCTSAESCPHARSLLYCTKVLKLWTVRAAQADHKMQACEVSISRKLHDGRARLHVHASDYHPGSTTLDPCWLTVTTVYIERSHRRICTDRYTVSAVVCMSAVTGYKANF